MRKIKKSFPDLIYIWIPRKYKAKDISDFYKYFGKISYKYNDKEYTELLADITPAKLKNKRIYA